MPGADAVIDGDTVYSYADLHRMVSQTVEWLREKQIDNNYRVGITGGNNLNFILLLAALWRINATTVPLCFRFPEEYIKEIENEFKLDLIIQSHDPIDFPPLPGWDRPPQIHLDQGTTIILTSGSTGKAKGVILSYGNHHYNALGSNENIPLEPGDRWLLSLPLYHVGGIAILFRCFLSGAAVALPIQEKSLLQSIEQLNITHLSLVSTQLMRLLDEKPSKDTKGTGHLKAVLLGGSAFSKDSIKRAVDNGLPVHTSYGMSEMASQVTATPPGAGLNRLLTSGKALKHRQVKISSEGEILVRGKTIFRGYQIGSTAYCMLDSTRWFHTGDLGELDQYGYLTVKGRKDNMFISGGENIMPEEIESILLSIPGIRQAVVIPKPDETYSFRPVAFIDLDETLIPNLETVIVNLETRLPRFKIPDIFYKWLDITENTSIKINRSKFQESFNKENNNVIYKKVKSFAGSKGGFSKEPLAVGDIKEE